MVLEINGLRKSNGLTEWGITMYMHGSEYFIAGTENTSKVACMRVGNSLLF
jgi:hypothetical protein